jgi:methylated-DNA-[protein]-cysteine S-methyltransferase
LESPPVAGIEPRAWQAQSAFRRTVYAALCRVPAGQVTTYGALARAVGCRCPRAVGQALRHNPFAPRVPCHRVVATDLSLGGFNGQRGGPALERKRQLLQAEGVLTMLSGKRQVCRIAGATAGEWVAPEAFEFAAVAGSSRPIRGPAQADAR